MSELGSGGGSSYPGALDTNSTPEVDSPNAGKTKVRADVPNDLAAAIIATQTELGTDPAGTKTDVKTFLQTEHNADGTHNVSNVVTIGGTQTITGAKTLSATMENDALVIWAKGADVASAAALPVISDGNLFDVTGTTTVTSIASLGIGAVIRLQFDDTLTLTHNATDLILPDGIDIITHAGDVVTLVEYASGDWLLTSYTRLPRATVQTVYVQDGAVATGTTLIPVDDSIPQITEGDEYITLAITPKNANNKLLIEIGVQAAHSAASGVLVMPLFQDATADALAVVSETYSGVNAHKNMKLVHEMTAGTTSATTFRIRLGSDAAGTVTFNGDTTARRFGGIASSHIRITELRE